MRKVDQAPLLDQIESPAPPSQGSGAPDCRPADGHPASPSRRAGPPAMHAHILDLKHPARTRVRPPRRHRAIDQPHQLELGLRAHAPRDRAGSQRCLPRCKLNSTASSLSASESRSFSANAASNSTCSGEGNLPGLAAANAASAASFANCLIRITVDTSTPHFRLRPPARAAASRPRRTPPTSPPATAAGACAACRSPSSRPPESGPGQPPRIGMKNRGSSIARSDANHRGSLRGCRRAGGRWRRRAARRRGCRAGLGACSGACAARASGCGAGRAEN